MDKNRKLKCKNEALEPFYHLLQTANVTFCGEVLKEINLMESGSDNDGDDGDEEHLTYLINNVEKFPYEQIKSLQMWVSGLELDGNVFINKGPKLTLLDDTGIPSAELVLHFDDHKMKGILTDFVGTLNDLQKMNDSNRFMNQYMWMGTTLSETPGSLNYDATLEGAMFTLRKIEIVKRFVEATLLLSQDESPLNAAALEQVKELEALVEANENHERLLEVADEHKALVHLNSILMEAAILVQTVEARLSGVPPIRFKLESGYKGGFEGYPVSQWCIEPMADENCTVPFASISRLAVFLANIRWTSGMAFPPQFLINTGSGPPFMIFMMKDDIFAVFGLDGNIEALDGDFESYIHDTIVRTSKIGQAGRIGGLMEPLDPEPQWTMQLLWLQVLLHVVQKHLDRLGVDTTVNDEDEQS